MGEIRASVRLENCGNREILVRGLGVEADVRRTTVEEVVDTGTVTLVIAEEIATKLGLRHRATRPAVYADERPEERPVTDVRIEIGDLATRTEAIVGTAGSKIATSVPVHAQFDQALSVARTLPPPAGASGG